MTSTAALRGLRDVVTPRLPRRVSGSARVPATWLGRLTDGRTFIPLIALGLLGIVFMQVSMLKLNAGIGRAIETSGTLELRNSDLRREVSRLAAVQRIEQAAVGLGLVRPEAGSFHYLTAGRRGDAQRAARSIRMPAPIAPGSTLPAPVLAPAVAPAVAVPAVPAAAAQAQAAPPVPPAPAAQAPSPPATPPPAPTGGTAAPGGQG